MSSYILRQELLNDPLVIGYSGMTDAVVLASLTDANLRPLADRGALTSAEIYNVIVRSEYQGLSAIEKEELGIILGLGSDIDIGASSKARGALAGMFNAGSGTRLALLALIEGRTQSRAVELGVKQSSLTVTGIAAARIMQP